jgi:HlyD family secretion protein
LTGELEVSGRLYLETVVRVGSTLPGQVVEVKAVPGDHVRRGQVLARLDDLEARAAVRVARADLSLAEVRAASASAPIRAILEREGYVPDRDVIDDRLGEAANVVEISVLTTSAEVDKRKATVALAQGLLARRLIRSPMDGIVLSRTIEAGETVAASPPAAPFFVIGSGPARLVARGAIDERYAPRVRPGLVYLKVPAYPGRRFEANLRSLSLAEAVDQLPARYEIELAVDNPGGELRAGMLAMATIPMSAPSRSLRVPVAALSRPPGAPSLSVPPAEPTIWLVDPSRHLTRVPVERGVSNGLLVEIQGAGLAAGQTVAWGR